MKCDPLLFIGDTLNLIIEEQKEIDNLKANYEKQIDLIANKYDK